MSYVCAIDAGWGSGSFILVHNDTIQTIQKIVGMAPENLIKVLKTTPPAMVVIIEQPPLSVGFNTGCASVKLNMQYAFLMGAMKILGTNTISVRPQVWQKPLGIPSKIKGDARKHALWEIAKERYPDEKIFLYAADSLLIYDYYRRLHA